MQLRCARSRLFGISLIEVLCATGVLSMVATVTFIRCNLRAEADQARCIHNLKETSLAFRQFASDNGNQFPMQVPELFGGAHEAAGSGEIAGIYRALSGYSLQPQHAICPADQRTPADLIATLEPKNLSYFLNLDAQRERPRALLLGDRDLMAGSSTRASGVLLSGIQKPGFAPETLRWSGDMHRKSGNIAFADGTVQRVPATALATVLNPADGSSPTLLFPQ